MAEEEEAEFIIGTYEDYVIGLSPCGLSPTFAVRSHSGSVRSLAGSADGSLVLSGGFDEKINLFSLKRRKLLQTLEGAVNCATFVESSHLICGSEDGNVYIYECKGSNMVRVKTLKGHKAGITSIDAHASGKILLSLSKDNTMRTWNLIKGRCAYVTHIKSQAHLVKWSKTGDEFVIAANNDIYLYNNTGNLKRSIKLEKRVNSVEFITENIFVVASDSGMLEFFDLKKDDCNPVIKFKAHEARIKSVGCFLISENQSATKFDKADKAIRLATASSDGLVKLWSISRQHDGIGEPKELANVDLGARLTCMIAVVRRVGR